MYSCILDAHRSKDLSALSAFLFCFFPYYLSHLKSPLDLSLKVTWHPAAPAETHTDRMKETKSCHRQPKPTFSSLMLLFLPCNLALVHCHSLLFTTLSLSLSPSFYHVPLITLPVFYLFFIFIYPSPTPKLALCWPEKDWHSEAGPLPAALTFLPDFDGAFEQRCVEGRAACLSAFQQL